MLILAPSYIDLQSSSLTEVSDRLGSSWPSGPSDHSITFRATTAIPAGGRIVITPQSADWHILPGLNYDDIDLATATARGGPYADRELAALSDAVRDGASVAADASSTLESIEIELNGSYGIAAGDYVSVQVGLEAMHGATGTRQVLNPAAVGTYHLDIATYGAADALLDRTGIAVATVEPVRMAGHIDKVRSNGTPSGYLTFGTTQTLMSLTTNYRATCRFGTTASTTYAAKTGEFTYTGEYYHWYLLTGLANGQNYYYYIRCRDELSVDDETDFVINFWISGQQGEEGEEAGTPGPGGGGSGGGGGGGQGPDRGPGTGAYLPYPPLPGLPGVVFTGWTYPAAEVNFLKDGAAAGKALGSVLGAFGAFMQDLDQGVYTFSLWSQDRAGRKSSTYSTTFWLEEGTQTTVADIIISPTLALGKSTVGSGEAVEATGFAVPGKGIEIWVYPAVSGAPDPAAVVKHQAMAGGDGAWSAILPTAGLAKGTYTVKAKTVIAGTGESDYSLPLSLNVGIAAPEETACSGADLNGDGRVNLTDFSILLYHWGTADACADQNKDGTVNLTDFSIMMFYWTG